MVKVRVCVCSPTLLCDLDQCMKYAISVNNAADVISLFLVCTFSTLPISSITAAAAALVTTTPLVAMVTSSLWLLLLQQHYRMKRSLYYFFDEVNMTNAILLKWGPVACDCSIRGHKSVKQKVIYRLTEQREASLFCNRQESSKLSITHHWLIQYIKYPALLHKTPWVTTTFYTFAFTSALCSHAICTLYHLHTINYTPAICLLAFSMTHFKRHFWIPRTGK